MRRISLPFAKHFALLIAALGGLLTLLAAAQHFSHPFGPAPGLADVFAALGFLCLAAGLWAGMRHQGARV